jgi:hypothetical protein
VEFVVETTGGKVLRDVAWCSLLAPGSRIDCAKTCRFLPAASRA